MWQESLRQNRKGCWFLVWIINQTQHASSTKLSAKISFKFTFRGSLLRQEFFKCVVFTLLDRGWGTSVKWDSPFLQSFKKHQLNTANQTCLTFSVSKNCLNSESSLKAGWVAVLLRYLHGNVAQQKLNHSLAMYPNAPYFIILLCLSS